MTELESGAVKNETVTTYTGKDKDGKDTVETITKDKDTGEVKREVNGEEVEQQKPITYQGSQQGNFEPIVVILLNNILNQLKEMNYYMSYLEKKDG